MFVEGRIHALILLIVATVICIYYMQRKELPYIRRVPALDAIDEAIGRATEMGKPIVCSHGIAVAGFDYWTMAGLSILAYVARHCAKTDTRLIVPCGGSEQSYTVTEVARELVRTQYVLEGKPEAFRLEDMPFLSGRQFPWASAYVGMLLRERPGANIWVGVQWASAMYIAEVTYQVGAIGIAGTSYLANISVLATSADYVMIGEELPAAGAYLSKDPAQLASIRMQDIMKVIGLIILVVGVIAMTMGNYFMVKILSW